VQTGSWGLCACIHPHHPAALQREAAAAVGASCIAKVCVRVCVCVWVYVCVCV